jgi:hypothetical protein
MEQIQTEDATARKASQLRFKGMNKNAQTPIGDLSGTETELTVPTPEMVTARAREIALTNERKPNEFTQEDWEQARRELTGMETSGASDDAVKRGAVPGQTGGQAPRLEPKDEAILVERLASRGVEEAAHVQRVEAAKEDQSQEG